MYSSMSYPATVSPFKLDKYTVTVGRFREFVEAGGGTQAQPPMSGAGERSLNGTADQGGWDASWNTDLATDSSALVAALKCDASFQTWTDAPGGNEELPINCITWYEAFAFCVWDGGFLPTEAEWNFAAAGGDEQRVYPWSSPPNDTTLDCTYANYSGCAGAPRRVGAYPQGAGRWKQADLAGNVWEWALDWYRDPYSNPCTDCANMSAATKRANRGGSFGFASLYLRTGIRGFEAPTPPHASIGVRCARH
jgi:formylglycine-generating enzyme required for sulfatase activity